MDAANRGRHQLEYTTSQLDLQTAALAQGHEAVCCFVNDDASAPVLERLAGLGVRCLVLRCTGFNNVDLEAAKRLGIVVMRVAHYSPYAVAEHAVALL
ncbi:MAG TPA: hypothetical protein PK954_11740, partial [Anaerolineales bacterium]|nr:hypothetical protein [Anaerolineales bacterium]